ncbi:hypothetical protein [Mucilaginibacter segetis]|uniref:Uncharacterized protein n=1 Tax=Mucilaginibacter segetis TaxID=2793071 RepID=A0A934PSY8_9SPHI|nr:hypothetical protein [Mucilaginibacter segetis]MBK0378470.1 hypothetical protein [Mucilaginibacter segetis]
MSFQKNSNTPALYISNNKIDNAEYNVDKEMIVKKFVEFLKVREGFFNNGSLSKSETQIIIDTIIYSPDFKKLGILVIVKTPTLLQLLPNKNQKWFYNSTFYLGIKQDHGIELKMVGPTFTNEKSFEIASENIREACFKHFIVKKSDIYKFNIDDERF